jgi:hypothetical protein
MRVVKGSELFKAFESINNLNDVVRFLHVREATALALEHGASVADLKRLLAMWMKASEPTHGKPQSSDAVDPVGEKVTE